MTRHADDGSAQRRTLLQGTAGLLALTALGGADRALAARSGKDDMPKAETLPPAARRKFTPGKPGDFDWLSGEWRIAHRRLKTPGGDDWDAFDGEATCWGILGGIAHVEELRIPARDFAGMGLRLLDLDTRVWSDYWVNAKSGVLGAAGLTGSFEQGEGVFESADTVEGKPMLYRGVWDRIVPGKSHRWTQSASGDGGATWSYNWFMDWRRA